MPKIDELRERLLSLNSQAHDIRLKAEGEKRDLTIAIVRILFPGAGLLVLSAWCLGILNSHRRFLLSYMAPVIWNVSMIVTLAWWGALTPLPRLAVILAWGAVVGLTVKTAVSPAALSAGAVTAATPGSACRASRMRPIVATSSAEESSTTTTIGPLNPGPKPSAS